MTEALYPHESPYFIACAGLTCLFLSLVIFIGTTLGWFSPPPPTILGGIYATTMTQTNPQPLLFGIDTCWLFILFAIVGTIMFAMGINSIPPLTASNDKDVEYCPHCKRRIP